MAVLSRGRLILAIAVALGGCSDGDTLLQLERTYLGLGNYGEADKVHRRAAAQAT